MLKSKEEIARLLQSKNKVLKAVRDCNAGESSGADLQKAVSIIALHHNLSKKDLWTWAYKQLKDMKVKNLTEEAQAKVKAEALAAKTEKRIAKAQATADAAAARAQARIEAAAAKAEAKAEAKVEAKIRSPEAAHVMEGKNHLIQLERLEKCDEGVWVEVFKKTRSPFLKKAILSGTTNYEVYDLALQGTNTLRLEVIKQIHKHVLRGEKLWA